MFACDDLITSSNNSINIVGNTRFNGAFIVPDVNDIIFENENVNMHTIPSGGIIIWNGLISDIPDGWLLCNGSNGTPNLQERFVIGSSSNYPYTSEGGSTTAVLIPENIPEHTHNGPTFEAGEHNHGGYTNNGNFDGAHEHTPQEIGAFNNKSYPSLNNQIPPIGSSSHDKNTSYDSVIGSQHIHSISFENGHTHNFETDNYGNSNPAPIVTTPPYYALAYIMKI